MDDNLQEAEERRHWDILSDVKAEALAKPPAVTLAEKRDKTVDESNSYKVEETMANRLGHTSAMGRPRHSSIPYLPLYQRSTLRQ